MKILLSAILILFASAPLHAAETEDAENARLRELIMNQIKTISELRDKIKELQTEIKQLRIAAGIDESEPLLAEQLAEIIRERFPHDATELQIDQAHQYLDEEIIGSRLALTGTVDDIDADGTAHLTYTSKETVEEKRGIKVQRRGGAAIVNSRVSLHNIVNVPREIIRVAAQLDSETAANLKKADEFSLTGTIHAIDEIETKPNNQVIFRVEVD